MQPEPAPHGESPQPIDADRRAQLPDLAALELAVAGRLGLVERLRRVLVGGAPGSAVLVASGERDRAIDNDRASRRGG